MMRLRHSEVTRHANLALKFNGCGILSRGSIVSDNMQQLGYACRQSIYFFSFLKITLRKRGKCCLVQHVLYTSIHFVKCQDSNRLACIRGTHKQSFLILSTKFHFI